MAGNRIDVTLSVNDTGGSLKQRNEEAKELNKTLTKAAQLSERAIKPAARREKDQPVGENVEYGRGRGAMGATGASARDFANEAQGLGGLVRLYATYAANLFAVSAAFNALSDAMNTTNMVKGLDQLGAASGVALGGLAKQFVEVTGGAVSLRESMEATTKAISSGLSQKQLLEIGEIAKKASQSLGLNMTDAVSRLTRGITKLEPELLDELGLFTKTGMAAEAYARSVGKSVSSLTDLERRQAFANAVLAEGRQKFNEIDIPTNPYDKLLASLRNVAQQLLEVVNKGLVPLIDYLSQSPTALTGVILGLGTMILRQALPIFQSYREAARRAAEESAEVARSKMAAAQKALQIAREAKANEVKIEKEKLAEIKDAEVEAAARRVQDVSRGPLSKKVKEIIDPKKSILEITDKDLAYLDKLGAKNTKVAAEYRALAAAIREAQEANQRYMASAKQAESKMSAPPGMLSTANAAMIRLESARRQEASANILSKVGETATTAGSLAAIKDLVGGIKTEKLGLLRGSLTAVSGAATIAASAVGTLFTVFSSFFAYIGIAVAIFEGLNSVFSKNTKEVEKFNQALENGEQVTKAAENTYKKYVEQLRPQALIAGSEALFNLSESLTDTVDALRKADSAAGGWDKFIDGFKTLYGGDLKSKFGENFAAQVDASLKSITDPSKREEVEKKLKELFQIQDVSKEALEKGIAQAKPERIVAIGQEVTQVFNSAAKQAKGLGDALKSAGEGFKTLEIAYQELSNTLVASDPLTKFGTSVAQQGFILQKVFQDPISAAAQLRDILQDTSKIRLLSPESQKMLMQTRDQFNMLSNDLKVIEDRMLETRKKADQYAGAEMYDEASAEEGRLKAQRASAQNIRNQMQEVAKSMSAAVAKSIDLGFELVQGSFARKMAEGVLNAQKSLLDKLPKTQETIALSTELENKKIDLQIEEIQVTERLIKEMELSRLSGERLAIERQRDAVISNADLDPSIRARAGSRAQELLKPITEREAILKSTNISEDIKAGKIGKTQDALSAMSRQLGTATKVQALEDQKRLNLLNAVVESKGLEFDRERESLQLTKTRNDALLRAFKTSDAFLGLTIEEQQTLENGFALTQAYIDKQLGTLESRKQIGISEIVIQESQAKGWSRITKAAENSKSLQEDILETQAESLNLGNRAAETERTRTQELARRTVAMERAAIQQEKETQLLKIKNDTEVAFYDISAQSLQQRLEQGQITIDQYNIETRSLEILRLEKEREMRINEIRANWLSRVTPLIKEYTAANETDKETIRLRIVAIAEETQAEINKINTVTDAQRRLKDTQENLSDRQKAYGDVFKRSFEGMADALLEFTQTGKVNFKGLINSMLADLLRYELRMQALMAYQAFRPFLMSLLGGGKQMDFSDVSNFTTDPNVLPGSFAKGGAFDTGVQKFAKGGMFTNKIVSEPTLFKFAKGAGVMGEAGPEAIMPLRRDGQGNLGVIAQPQQGNVEVVVNNYSGEKAETRETMDNRGNRKIEVVIGEMVASEVGRKNSPMQQAIGNNFMTKPAVVRR